MAGKSSFGADVFRNVVGSLRGSKSLNGRSVSEYVQDNLIYQSGVDFESKPIVVFCACNLPDPKEVDYDNLLDCIMEKLDEFVENDYTAVLFVGGAVHKPSWSWLFKAHGRLSRKYKKNLKSLHVVHPSLWVKILMDAMYKIISPKFARKVTWISTLSQLGGYVPLNQLNIPNAVYDHNMKYETNIDMDAYISESGQSVFGVDIIHLMGENGELGIPKVIQDCAALLLENGLDQEGLFRRSPSSALLKEVKLKYNLNQQVDLESHDINIAAVLMKIFLRELKNPVFPIELYDTIKEFDSKASEKDKIQFVQTRIFTELSTPMLHLLSYVFNVLYQVSLHSNENKMTSYNLAVVWSPNLVRSANPMLDVSLCVVGGSTVGSIVKLMIDEYHEVFSEFPLSKISTSPDDDLPAYRKPSVPPPVPPKPRLTDSN